MISLPFFFLKRRYVDITADGHSNEKARVTYLFTGHVGNSDTDMLID